MVPFPGSTNGICQCVGTPTAGRARLAFKIGGLRRKRKKKKTKTTPPSTHVCLPTSVPGYKYPALSVLGCGVGEFKWEWRETVPRGRRKGEEPFSHLAALGGGCRARVGWLFPWGNAGAGHGGHRSGKWDPTSGVAVPAGTSGGKAEEFPKGPWRQRGGCQEGMKGSADGSRGSLPGWHGHCGDTPPPSAPSAWRSKVGGGGQAQRTPLHPDILPQISPSRSQEKRSQR